MPVISVDVLDDGSMQLTVDAMKWSPLPLDAVQALAARIPDAQAAGQRQDLTGAIRSLTAILVASGADMTAEVTLDATSLTAHVDGASFDRAQAALGVDPGGDGGLNAGPVTIYRRSDPTPDPAPEPDPTPGPDPEPAPDPPLDPDPPASDPTVDPVAA